MLYKETLSPNVLELLIRLQSKEYLKDFYLVGGTALALQIGHRTSIDLDLFSTFEFDTEQLLDNLTADFSFKLFFSAKNTLKGSIEDIKVDILAHRYPFVSSPLNLESVRMISIEDIIAMKLNAISVSGQRVKDFVDIYYLLNIFSLADMMRFYRKKYASFNEVNVIKSLNWFEDLDLSGWPVLLQNPTLKLSGIKKKLKLETQKYLHQI